MGIQQLLYVALGVILVGIAVVVSLFLFRTYAMNRHREAMVSEMNRLMVDAIAFKKIPTSMGGGGGVYWGYAPGGSEPYNGHIGSPANSGFRMLGPDVNYFVELWAEGAYPQRVKIIASSKIYGEGNFWSNTYNARIIASFDAEGNVIYSHIADRNGFQITGEWRR